MPSVDRRSPSTRRGSNKTAWVIVLLVATFVLGIGLFLAAYYLFVVRRKVRQQTQLLSERLQAVNS
jgi:hypothetical protein